MGIVEKSRQARRRCGLLHDYNPDIAHLQIDLTIDIKIGDGGRSENCFCGKREDLVIVTKRSGVREEKAVGELVL